ncbi:MULTISPECIES: SIS domain-containing protein [unclassified Mesorhizobium]|uniref:SIS domain-containing protein n=1 Tax=unclassified Mesorhizobium TaxID=325217 RepID=UPI000FCA75A8|nr:MULTISPECIES: SIS domain-containing protein [unclassified Mesorhizobium]RUU42662.1 SIS domain-containing protein [Mesorhizobium sp. M6A.T.Ce.TU.002.03.1.1]RUU28592.1 SIS domain-containing protein [Mesorhizobium sp. M6A.T.Ce.TU.016.01.1.1]RVB79093.1 SIS domain-containing protein [Mesorhizobium sp. M6A.T.Cr.TU.014.01.1.1]RWQ10041.1 MAG: SIS domain-containing protein [Mesorhizobium sp.]RWQ11246.1 MAG: SIS domain-containing protein [Mesorhizobium sp.]
MDSRQIAQSRPWLAVGQEITDLLGRIDVDAFARLVQAFDDPDQRWFFSGQGRSGLVAQMGAMRFMHLGRTVHFVGEVSAPSIRRGDALLIVSGSGETPVSTGFARIAKAEGAKVVTLTHEPAGTLAGIADVTLHVPVGESKQFGGSLFEQSCLVLLDSVVLGLAQQIPDAHKLMLFRHTNLQ